MHLYYFFRYHSGYKYYISCFSVFCKTALFSSYFRSDSSALSIHQNPDHTFSHVAHYADPPMEFAFVCSPGSIMKMNLLRSGISPLLYMLNIMLSVYSSFKIGLFGSLAYCNLGVLLTHLNLHSFTLRLSITGRWSLLQSEQKYVLHCKTWISH